MISRLAILGLCASLHLAAAITHDFGSVNVASSASFAFSVTLTGVTVAPSLSVTGSPFSIASGTCSLISGSANCTATVLFAPAYPGLQTGALLIKNSAGVLLGAYVLRGLGMAAQLAFNPGIITALAGTGSWGYADGTLASASFRNPSGVALDHSGNLYVADSVNQVIRKITSTAVSTVAGNGAAGYLGDNGPATSATLNNPTGIAVDAANNLYIADQGNGLIRRVDAISGIMTTVAGGGSTLVTAASSNVNARNASLYGPQAVVVDPAGNLFVSDSLHQMVVRVDAVTSVITAYAGGGTASGIDGSGDGAAATTAILNNPTGLALDSSSNLYIADTGHSMIRMVNASTGIITVAAGSGNYGYAGDSGAATSASLASPMGIKVDSAGNLYIADFGNNVIRQTLAATGTISTLAGTGTNGSSGNGGLATSALLANPTDIVLSPAGTLFIADYGNNVIRQINPVSPALAFSSVNVGTASTTQKVSLVNRGNQALTISGLALGSAFKQVAGSAACATGTVLAAGGTCSAVLEFVPTSAGAVSSSLSLTTNSLNVSGTQAVSLSGTGVNGVSPTAVLNKSSLSFGTVATGSSASQTVTLSNGGNAALSIAGIVLGGSSAFALSTTCGATLAAGSSCVTTVTLTPPTGSSYSGILTFSDSAASSPQQVTLSGVGSGGPTGSVNTTSLYYSSVLSGSNLAQSVTLTNTGVGVLSVYGISLSGPNSADFSVTTACGATLAVGQSCATAVTFAAGAIGLRSALLTIVDNGSSSPHVISLAGAGPTTPLQFVPVTPCRVADTRLANGPYGGPELATNATRNFLLPGGACGIPSNAAAYSLNITVVPDPGLGYLAVWPSGLPQPLVSTLTLESEIRANAAVVTAGVSGGVAVYVSTASHVVLDINGYFVAGNSAALNFYPVPPCRIVDTRGPIGPLGGPSLGGGVPRSFPILSSTCNIPSTAQAYSLNFTSVPNGALYFLSTWPAGQPQPLVSTLNAFGGVVTANAAIVPAGIGGAVDVYASNGSDVVIDINGYFAPGATGGLSLYTVTPCRPLDTRQNAGQFNGTVSVDVNTSVCATPSSASAFIFNATVVPSGYFGYLTLWPSGTEQPLVSTLNATDGLYTSNMAIVPATNGTVSAFGSNPVQLILDLEGYFAP